MRLPWAYHAALVVVMAILALTPGSALEALRWIAFIATGAVLLRMTLERRRPRAQALTSSTLSDGAEQLSAMFLVELDGGVHKQLSDAENVQVLEAITRSVRVSDTVRMTQGGRFTVHLEGVTPALARQVGERICDQVRDLIVFDRSGGLIVMPVAIGGVIGVSGDGALPLGIARENLAIARDLEGQRLVISTALPAPSGG